MSFGVCEGRAAADTRAGRVRWKCFLRGEPLTRTPQFEGSRVDLDEDTAGSLFKDVDGEPVLNVFYDQKGGWASSPVLL